MALNDVQTFFKEKNLDYEILEFNESSATVNLAANALGVEPDLIAKTLATKLKDRSILIVTKGTAKIDNRKYKDFFQTKCKMLKFDEVLEETGHPVGGVCPFGLRNPLEIYLDVSLKEFEYVYPAAGSKNSAIKITPDEIQNITSGEWIDVCK